jgi:16S rRNA (cytidine1402-2'-O)-methyltransferase
MEAGLYVVATPIGNLGDITLRAIDTLRDCDLILAEDTRHTRRLLNHLDIQTRLQSCHKFNEAARLESFTEEIRQGRALALVSDAGTPGISDPGSRLVAACRSEDLPVYAIPGSSSVTAAVSAAGLRSTAWIFGGFLPPKPGKRKKELLRYLETGLPVILMVSPYKLLKVLELLMETAPQKRLGAYKEITKKFEAFISGNAAQLHEHFSRGVVKGEYILILYDDDTP